MCTSHVSVKKLMPLRCVDIQIMSVYHSITLVNRVRSYITKYREGIRGLTVNRRNVVIFLALMGMFVTYTQAFTVNTFETNAEFSNLSKYTGPEDFLTVYETQPLGKNKVLGTLEITNRLGISATTYVIIIPTNSTEQPIEVGTVTTYDYKIGAGSWITVAYEDLAEIMASVEITISSGSTETVYFLFEKTNLAVDYYMSNIVVQEKES